MTPRLNTLGGIRRELARVYASASNIEEQNSSGIAHFRGLTYILNIIAEVLKAEKIADLEARVQVLEAMEKQLAIQGKEVQGAMNGKHK